jgi:hypothetical protein
MVSLLERWMQPVTEPGCDEGRPEMSNVGVAERKTELGGSTEEKEVQTEQTLFAENYAG